MNADGNNKTVTVSLGAVGRVPPARNAPCHCGSGKKFKKCHRLIEHEDGRQRNEALRARFAAEAAAERQAYEERRGQTVIELERRGGRRLGHAAVASLLAMAAMGPSR